MAMTMFTRTAPCEMWADHDFSAVRVIETGRHLVCGYYQRVEWVCAHCGRCTTETVWLDADWPRGRPLPRGGEEE